MDPAEYVVGCVVAAENVPIAHKKGESQELRPVPNGFYRVTKVHPTSLRLVNLITGEERTLPREYCRRSDLTDLSQYQLKIREHQFKLLVRNLFRENKYLSPDGAKVWENLSFFKFPELTDDIDDDESDSESPHDTQDNESNLERGDQSNMEDNLLIDTTGDAVINTNDPMVVVDPDERRYRETRSGRSYCISVEDIPPSIDAISPLPSILVSRPHTNDLAAMQAQYPLAPPDHQCHESAKELSLELGTDSNVQEVAFINVDLTSKKDKKITWKETISERTYEIGSKSYQYLSELMQSLEKKVVPQSVYFMCHFVDINLLDVSLKELFWKTSRFPNPDTCLLMENYDEQ